jgi:hypothetical protein
VQLQTSVDHCLQSSQYGSIRCGNAEASKLSSSAGGAPQGRRIVQARAALSQVHLLINGSSSSFANPSNVSEKGMVEFLEAMNSVPMLGDFAATALLQLQQQPILQASAADLATMIMIMEGLACALRLPSSKPATAKKLEQQTREAKTGADGRPWLGLYCCCICTFCYHNTQRAFQMNIISQRLPQIQMHAAHQCRTGVLRASNK